MGKYQGGTGSLPSAAEHNPQPYRNQGTSWHSRDALSTLPSSCLFFLSLRRLFRSVASSCHSPAPPSSILSSKQAMKPSKASPASPSSLHPPLYHPSPLFSLLLLFLPLFSSSSSSPGVECGCVGQCQLWSMCRRSQQPGGSESTGLGCSRLPLH